MKDKKVQNLIKEEEKRQGDTINLIASENYASDDVLDALGSVFVNKYAEGYPKSRYYGGNETVDKIENLCKERALKLFKLPSKRWDVNVQPYSGSPANLAIYTALIPRGGKIMGMSLQMGGHLTHGQKVSVTGKFWKQVSYGVDKKTPARNASVKRSIGDAGGEKLDYDEIMKIAKKEKPDIIVTGYTAYSRKIDFKKFRQIADKCGAYLLVDMSHIAGLIAGKAHSSPFPYADVVMTTTHKTLRGPRGAMIFSRKLKIKSKKSNILISEAINKAVFPGLQGGPHVNQITATAIALKEASTPAFKKYSSQVVKNAQALADSLKKKGWRIISGGTDNHLFLVDTWANGISGKEASDKLEKCGIIVNKNSIPFDTRKPADPSGIRIGTPAITTVGMKEKEMETVADFIDKVLRNC